VTEDQQEKRNDDKSVGRVPGPERRVTIVNDRMESRDSFIGTRDIIILHDGSAYHLRLTAQNKLILTK
jgi:hemin uptake protein HemP